MRQLKQSTTRNLVFWMYSSTDHVSAVTGITPTVTISKDGGSFASAGGTVTEIANGAYKIALTTTDTNTLGDLAFYCTGTGADASRFTVAVVADLPGASVSSVTGAVGSVTGNVGGNVVGSVASVTAGVTVTTNNDKTGYGLSAAAVQAIWDALTSALTTANSIGKLLVDNINATISSRLASASISLSGGAVTVGTNNDKTGYTASTVSDKTGYSLASSQTFNVTGNITGNLSGSVGSVTSGVTVTTNNDKTGYGLSAAAVQAIWDALTSALTTVGSIGKLIVTNLDAAISSRSTVTTAQVNAEVVDALATDTYAEPSSVPAATSSLKDKIGWLFTASRNKVTQTATTQKIRNDADSADIASATVSDDGTTFTKGEFS